MSTISFNPAEQRLIQSGYLTKVYAWMCMALSITALTAAFVAGTPAIAHAVTGNHLVFYALLFGELGLVFVIAGAIDRLSATAATGLFVLYSILNGLTMSVVFLVYTASSIGTTFLVTAGTFGAMSLYGYTTKRDLTSIGNLLLMALVGLIIASVVNIFMQSSVLQWVCTFAGILIFVGLTAYDTQKLKTMAAGGFDTSDRMQKSAILGALTLYLDFINLFLLLLDLFGGRRRD